MTTPELIDYVKKGIEAGISRDLISDKLKAQGWNEIDITEVFSVVTGPITINESTPKINPTLIPDSPIIQDKFINGSVQNPSLEQNFQTSNNLNSTFVQPGKIGRIKKILIPLIIVVILVGAIFAYGFGYFNNSSKLFSQVIESSKGKTSLSYDFNLNLDSSNIKSTSNFSSVGLDKFKVITLGMKGSSDFSDKDNIKLKNSLLFKASDVEAGIDFRIINQSIYLSLTKAPDLGFFSLKPFENKWVVSHIEATSKDLANNPLTASISPVSASLFSDYTDEQKQHISDILKNGKFIKITKKHLPEIVDGSLSYHFDFDIDKEGTISSVKEVREYIESLNKNSGELTEMNGPDYDKVFDFMKTFQGEAWIGIFDKLPKKILINADIVNPEKIDDGVSKLTMSVVYTDWGMPVEVEVPVGAVTISELMSGMFDGSIENTQMEIDAPTQIKDINQVEETKDDEHTSVIKSVLIKMTTQSENYFIDNNNSYKGFCSSKGSNGAYPLAITLPKNSVYKCKDSSNEWVSWVQLMSKDYLCSDNTGNINTIKVLPSELSCGN